MNKTSAYLDLSILYGDNQDDQDMIRTFQDGKLKPDCFAEERLQAFPPACCVLMVMLNRLVFFSTGNAILTRGKVPQPCC